MVTHPENTGKKAQAEIDRVGWAWIACQALKTRQSLPYIDAIYREVLRWKPPDPMGIAHRAEKDDTYKGYLIPEGSPRCPLILSPFFLTYLRRDSGQREIYGKSFCPKHRAKINGLIHQGNGGGMRHSIPMQTPSSQSDSLEQTGKLAGDDRVLAFGFGRR